MSGTQVMEHYQSILEEEVHDIAWETGAIKRRGKLDAATFAQMMIFGYRPRSRSAFEWIVPDRREKRSSGDRIGDQPTIYARVCQNVSENPPTTRRDTVTN